MAIELWGCAKPSNTKILQTFQSKTPHAKLNAPWFISNQTIHDDVKIPFISEVIRSSTTNHRNCTSNLSLYLMSKGKPLFPEPRADIRVGCFL